MRTFLVGKRIWLLVLVGLLLAALPALALSPSADYAVDWWTVDGGGGTLDSGSGYLLAGTIGQADTGRWSGGEYVLGGGFWGTASGRPYQIYLPVTLR